MKFLKIHIIYYYKMKKKNTKKLEAVFDRKFHGTFQRFEVFAFVFNVLFCDCLFLILSLNFLFHLDWRGVGWCCVSHNWIAFFIIEEIYYEK